MVIVKNKDEVVAEAVRIEYDKYNDTVYIVFEISDEKFKKEIKEDWTKDVPLKLVNKQLVRDK